MSSNFRIRKLTKIGLACASKELLETILITRFWRLIKRLRFDWQVMRTTSKMLKDMQERNLCLQGILGDPGADSGGEGKSKFSSRHFSPARLDFLSPPLSAPGSPRMLAGYSLNYLKCNNDHSTKCISYLSLNICLSFSVHMFLCFLSLRVASGSRMRPVKR